MQIIVSFQLSLEDGKRYMNRKFQKFLISTTAKMNLLYEQIIKFIALNSSISFIRHHFYKTNLNNILGIGGVDLWPGLQGSRWHPVQAEVHMECTNVIHQHPSDNGLDGCWSTICVYRPSCQLQWFKANRFSPPQP